MVQISLLTASIERSLLSTELVECFLTTTVLLTIDDERVHAGNAENDHAHNEHRRNCAALKRNVDGVRAAGGRDEPHGGGRGPHVGADAHPQTREPSKRGARRAAEERGDEEFDFGEVVGLEQFAAQPGAAIGTIGIAA